MSLATRPSLRSVPARATRVPRLRTLAGACALLACGCMAAARAEHADRGKEIAVTASDATADHARQTAEFSGDVVVSQGTLEIHADRVRMRLGANGERLGFAYGKAGAPVRFRQHGDRPDEWSEGQADRVEYDSLANEVRLIGAASLRNLNGTVVAQSVSGETITYDTARDTISSTRADQRVLQAGESRPAQRVRIVFAPTVTSAADAAGTTSTR
jgi:lipopolysaccharide export system protein LptA